MLGIVMYEYNGKLRKDYCDGLLCKGPTCEHAFFPSLTETFPVVVCDALAMSSWLKIGSN